MRKIIPFLIILLILTSCGKKEEDVFIEFTGDPLIASYLEEIDMLSTDYIQSYHGEINYDKEVDTQVLGSQEIEYRVTDGEKTVHYLVHFEVVDLRDFKDKGGILTEGEIYRIKDTVIPNEGIELINGEELIDTSKAGEVEITVKYKVAGVEKQLVFTKWVQAKPNYPYFVVDMRERIFYSQSEIDLYAGISAYEIQEGKAVPVDWAVIEADYQLEGNGSYYALYQIDPNKHAGDIPYSYIYFRYEPDLYVDAERTELRTFLNPFMQYYIKYRNQSFDHSGSQKTKIDVPLGMLLPSGQYVLDAGMFHFDMEDIQYYGERYFNIAVEERSCGAMLVYNETKNSCSDSLEYGVYPEILPEVSYQNEQIEYEEDKIIVMYQKTATYPKEYGIEDEITKITIVLVEDEDGYQIIRYDNGETVK